MLFKLLTYRCLFLSLSFSWIALLVSGCDAPTKSAGSSSKQGQGNLFRITNGSSQLIKKLTIRYGDKICEIKDLQCEQVIHKRMYVRSPEILRLTILYEDGQKVERQIGPWPIPPGAHPQIIIEDNGKIETR